MKAGPMQSQGKVKRQEKMKTRSGQVHGQVEARSRRGLGKVKARSRSGQGKVERQGQGKINVRLKQSNHNNNPNYNLMGFDTIEINLVSFKMSGLPSL